MARSEYAELPCVIVTPVVEVVSVAAMAVSLAQPLFLTVTFRLEHSLALITPLPLPFGASLMAKLVNWRFERPVMQKFCMAEPPLGGDTSTVAGDALVQIRSESAAVAV